jgi:hypothetical protein
MTPNQWIQDVVNRFRQNQLDSEGLRQNADKISQLVTSFSSQLSALNPPSDNPESEQLTALSKDCFDTFAAAVSKLHAVANGAPQDQLDEASALSSRADSLIQEILQKTAS